MFFVLKKSQLILALLLVFTLVFAVCFSFADRNKEEDLCLDLISSLGYEAESKNPTIEEISIPEGFGEVYEGYNLLQKEAGYDLTPLRGLKVKRYSYKLKSNEDLVINILIYEGKIKGGDIANISVKGKMLPLSKKE